MTEQQHLLMKVAEEAGEVVQASMKAAEFGLDDKHPETGVSNEEQLAKEIVELNTVANMLELRKTQSDGKIMEEKIERVKEWMEYARECGTLEPKQEESDA